MKTHMLIHSGEKPYECSVSSCRQRFRTYGHLKDHLSTHFDLRFYYCDVCGLSFSRKWTLKKHSYTHTGEKPFECTVCRKKFADKSNLTTHWKKHKECSTEIKQEGPVNPPIQDFCCKEEGGSEHRKSLKKASSKNNLNLSTQNCDGELYKEEKEENSVLSPKDALEDLAMFDEQSLFFNSLNHMYVENDAFETKMSVMYLFKYLSEN